MLLSYKVYKVYQVIKFVIVKRLRVIIFRYLFCFINFTNFINFQLSAQPATIQGYAPDYKNKTVSAYTYSDYITNTPLKLTSATISDSGYFTLSLDNLKHCSYTYLNIDNVKGTIYIEPGKLYRVAFPPPDTNHYHNPYIQQVVDLDFIIRDTNDINNLIIDFNEQFDKFWKKYY